MKVEPIQIVLDTNVLVSAMRSRRGMSYRLLSLIDEGRFQINLSVALAFEYEEVLKRPEQALFISDGEVDGLVNFLCSRSRLREIYYLWRPTLPDADDDFLLELAVESNAEYIVTFNSRDFLVASGRGFKAVTPAQFLKIIGETT